MKSLEKDKKASEEAFNEIKRLAKRANIDINKGQRELLESKWGWTPEHDLASGWINDIRLIKGEKK